MAPTKATIFLGALLLLSAAGVRRSQVKVEKGNVHLTDDSGKTIAVTSVGADSEAVLSLDGNNLAFIRDVRTPAPSPAGSVQPSRVTHLWMASKQDAWRPRPLLQAPVSVRGVPLEWFHSPRFSPDGAEIYFLAEGYSVVTAVLMRVDTATGVTSFVTTALKFWVVERGYDLGRLVVRQDRPQLMGGRLPMYFLIDKEGKELGLVGLNEEDVRFYLEEFLVDTKSPR